jgi:hypothetical protein
MMKTVSRIIIPVLFAFCIVTFIDLTVSSCNYDQGEHEMFFYNQTGEALHHNHCKEIEIFHEHFFDQTGHADLSLIQVPPIKIHQDTKAVLLNFSSNYWHPPKQA